VGAGRSYELGDRISMVLVGAGQSYELSDRASWAIV
jgi:hypothetical protein